jgi:hypothetical protein
MRDVVAFDVDVDDPSAVFDRVIAKSHTIATRCDVLFNRETIASGLAVTGGTVDYDVNAAHQARVSYLTIADPDRVPVSSSDILTPYGYELLLWRGVKVGAGSIVAPLGVFPIQTSLADGVTLLSTITAADRSKLVSDARFEDTYQIAAGTNVATAIEALISDGVNGLTYSFPSTTFTTPLLTFGSSDDRWTVARQMARDIGMNLYFDGLGVCSMKAESTYSDEPAAMLSEGENMVTANLLLDRGPAYNKVIAVSSNASLDDQYRGEAQDDDPASPTQYDGPFGNKVRFHPSPFYASDAQCAAGAASILASELGVAQTVSFSSWVNPRWEVSDVIQVTRTALDLDDLHILDTLSIGLSADSSMTGQCRTRQVAS